MYRVLRFLVWLLAKLILSLRYRVRVEGLDEIKGLRNALILPNHPAYVDPPLVFCILWRVLDPRPMLRGRLFRNPLLFWLPRALDAVEVPELDQPSAVARVQANEAISAVVAGLRGGKNHILWPAGQTQRRNFEALGAARSVTDVLRNVPDANVVLVRTCGLRGSMFSYARTGVQPNLVRCLLKGIAILAANLIFFTPRRPVCITVAKVDRDRLPDLTRKELNPFLETWYNATGPELPTYVRYHAIFGRRNFNFPETDGVVVVDFRQITPQIKSAVFEMIVEKLGHELPDEDRKAQTNLDTLGLDSLDRTELLLAAEQRFGFTAVQVPVTIGDLWVLAQGLTESGPSMSPPQRWFKPASGDAIVGLLGPTVPEAFVRRALANRHDVVAADDLSGAQSYGRFLIGALALAKRFRKIESANVGLMLPASVATDMAIIALHLAGKLPVLMNWTTGPANLMHAAKLMQVTHVISSRKFVDRTSISIDSTRNVFLEDVRATMGKLELLWIFIQTRIAARTILSRIPKVLPDATAVVLFTSGSEKAPKAVPLTHGNVLSNIQSVLDAYTLSRQESLLGFLPPFHSFGLTGTCLLPILGGLRVVHHPDPTDAGGLARKIAAFKPTIICGTPTFISYLLDRAQPEDLASIRLVIVGAEKCPASLFKRFAAKAPSASVLEGYGITECSPLISSNLLDQTRAGSVGRPLPTVEVNVVDPETLVPRSPGEMGMLLVSGPNVFPGYIGHDGPDPFCDQDGKRWYITGDLGRVDGEGFIFFCGRLKRFLKAGGEMISLPALEDPFVQQFGSTEDGPRVAVEGVETDSGRWITLFTTEDIALSEANTILFEKGFRGVLRFDEVRRVDQIPVLGTGKIDYKVLRGWIT